MKNWIALFLTSLFFITSVQAKDLRFVQVSDVRYSIDSENTLLKEVIKDINKQKNVEFVIFTGDNIAKPSQEELKGFLNEIKKLKAPYYIVIGDKDVNKHKNLSKAEYTKILKKEIKRYKPESPNYSFETKDVVFIVIDGAKDVIPSTNGYFKEETLSWFENELNLYSAKKVIVFQHFPIIPPIEKESYYTFKPESYLKILGNHPNVIAVISGHFGVDTQKNINNVEHITTSGIPNYKIIDILDVETQNPTIWAQLKQAK